MVRVTGEGLLRPLLTSNAVIEPWKWLPAACVILGLNTLLVLLLVSFVLGFGSGRGCLGVALVASVVRWLPSSLLRPRFPALGDAMSAPWDRCSICTVPPILNT